MYFKASPPLLNHPLSVAWLAGIIEGEGCFLTMPRRIYVVVAMTDQDVMVRVAHLFGVTLQSYFPARVGSKQVFVARATGGRAASIICAVSSFLGVRRRAQAQACLTAYTKFLEDKDARNAAQCQCSDAELVQAWRAQPPGASLRQLSRTLGIANHGHVKNRLIRLGLIGTEESKPVALPSLGPPLQAEAPDELWWAYFAGYLEGEGCFYFVGRAVRISVNSVDGDVLALFANRMGVNLGKRAPHKKNWQPLYVLTFGGSNAELVMRNILPHMGARRKARIEQCLVVRDACNQWRIARSSRSASAVSC